jgi:Zn-finger nucleic acid-binding protein
VAGQVREINHGRLKQIIQHRIKPGVVRYKPCPICQKMMNRNAFSKHIAVIVDECRGHGIWLDNGEFTVLAEWMEAGGRQHVEAEMARQARIDAANGAVDKIKLNTEASATSSTDLPPSLAEYFDSKTNAKFNENLPAWLVGGVLTLLLYFLLGLSWPVFLLAAGTALAWWLKK